ncbi:MAG: tetratricopeptide repeat protein [bacterium]
MAVINYERKDFQPAKEGFRKVIAVDPSCTDAYYSLAVIYATEGDITRAMQLLREATRIRPDFLRAHTLMEKIMKKGM